MIGTTYTNYARESTGSSRSIQLERSEADSTDGEERMEDPFLLNVPGSRGLQEWRRSSISEDRHPVK